MFPFRPFGPALLLLFVALFATHTAGSNFITNESGVLLTAKLLNASAAVAANPLVNATVSKLSVGQSATLSASDQFLGLPKAKALAVTPTATDAALPLSTLGGACGAGVASCLHGCCSQVGVCGISAAACGSMCQPQYSSPHSPCRGKNSEPTSPDTLPLVGAGAVCGDYVARCASGCCNQLNYCEAETDAATGKPSFACSLSSCALAASPNSTACKAVHARAKPVTRRFKFVATWGKAAPDGFEVDAVLINGQYPGPTIYANAGDRIIVQFINLLGTPSTIHWHGIKQVTTDFEDGVGAITQVDVSGITVGRRRKLSWAPAAMAAAGAGNGAAPSLPIFTYNFIVDAAGSYWYHDHSQQLTYVDGLRGALVVADPWSAVVPEFPQGLNSPTIFVSDMYHQKASVLAAQYINPANSDGVEPVPKSFWINGLAGVRTPWCGGGGGQPPCRSAVINAAPLGSCAAPNTGLVFVSGAAFGFVRIHLEIAVPYRALLLTVDGITLATPRPILMTPASPLELQPGQRYRVVLCSDNPAAASARPGRIVIRAPLEQFGTAGPDTNGLGLDGPPCTPKNLNNCSIVDTATAVLNFGRPYSQTTIDGDALPFPGSLSLPFNGPTLESLAESAVTQAKVGGVKIAGPTSVPPPPSTKTVNILLSTGTLSATSPQYFFFNNITFSSPAAPSLLDKTLTAGALPPNAAPGTAGYNVLDLTFGDVVDLVIYNTDTGVHPLHLHGQSFWIMAQGPQNSGPYDPATTPLVATEARDVAAVQAGSYLVIRFQASLPTLWFFHCHIEWHLADGLALVVSTTA